MPGFSPASERLKVTVLANASEPPVSKAIASVFSPSPGVALSPILSANVAVPLPAPVPSERLVRARRGVPRLSPARLNVAPGPTARERTKVAFASPPARARRAPLVTLSASVAVTGPLNVSVPPSTLVAPRWS